MHKSRSYQNGKIYKIVEIAYELCYIGSTTTRLSSRLTQHRRCYDAYLHGKCTHISVYEIFDTFGFHNCKIELVESFPCASIEELRAREGYYIERNPCVNKTIPGRDLDQAAYRAAMKAHGFVCDVCGGRYMTEHTKRRHLLTKKHQDALANLAAASLSPIADPIPEILQLVPDVHQPGPLPVLTL